jgi:hypothetical protein
MLAASALGDATALGALVGTREAVPVGEAVLEQDASRMPIRRMAAVRFSIVSYLIPFLIRATIRRYDFGPASESRQESNLASRGQDAPATVFVVWPTMMSPIALPAGS